MKKVIVALAVLLLGMVVFAGDITAVTSSGRTVILHDNGRWEYKNSAAVNTGSLIGKWGFTEDMIYSLVAEVLKEEGLSPSSSEYSFYMAIMMEAMMEDFPSTDDYYLEFRKDGTIGMYEDGYESDYLTYSLDDDTRILMVDGAPFGIFSSDYTKLYIYGQDTVYLSKLN